MKNDFPIGVFDSGIGGLSVLKALRARLPKESYIYLGDTARLPYGTKSKQTVARYAQQATSYLVELGVKMVVIACNTASAMALPALQSQFPGVPIVGVIEPGAQAACDASRSQHIVVAATETTIANKVYQHAIHRLLPTATVIGQPCSLFVSLAEEGWLNDEITDQVVGRYLLPYFNHRDQKADCLLLGCTHFPALMPTISRVLGDKISIVDSARTTADAVARELDSQQLKTNRDAMGNITYYATDAAERFTQIAQYFLQEIIPVDTIHLVDILRN